MEPKRTTPKDGNLAKMERRLHVVIDLGFEKALRVRAELAAKGLCEPDATISLRPSSRLEDYPDDELPHQ